MYTSDALHWFRDDLRLEDNPALSAATSHGTTVGLYVLETPGTGVRSLGGATKWWLHHSLRALATELAEHDIPLLVMAGDPRAVVPQVASQVGARFVSWTRRYHQPQRDIDATVKDNLRSAGLEAHSYPGFLLAEPWEVRTQQGAGYKVFTPYFAALDKFLAAQQWEGCELAVGKLGPGADVAATARMIDDLALLPTHPARREPDWTRGLAERWTPGERGATERLEDFLAKPDYARNRDFPAIDATSNLSPHLRFGEISPRAAWQASSSETFRKELGWREFAWHRLYHVPTMTQDTIRPRFQNFPWYWMPRDGASHPAASDLTAWQRGETGIELADAGLRELIHTGYMHNRVRMVVGSLLTKNLGIHWRHGEEWFWDTLVDADPASNAFNWQWVAGCGDDAAPYFRIFNPDTQAKKFDPDGHYRDKWIPERHSPAYPPPIVDLKESRAMALEMYRAC
ncbi:deoxyribodipyrimidine photo-lyase [Corynebacterium hindlerae]|uniref:cryptochrome/photolyase family protein n=1 Tax=Corynebacterium hindlerae TaxID=699041 RepID=UPI001AD697BF|nr:deoxyribodipyrimidine photo-lyase [Corynebacterium hindlerae]QTH59950.1 deoxyribodipyrimidine photo-lyase [Corynebacterium hindlerae]